MCGRFSRYFPRGKDQNVKKAIEEYEEGNLPEATATALKYYDKTYDHAVESIRARSICSLNFHKQLLVNGSRSLPRSKIVILKTK